LRVPQCDGKVHRAVVDRLGADGKVLPTRQYYQLSPVANPYQLTQH